MTRIQCLSDLHADEVPVTPVRAPGADVIVVAGDTRRGIRDGFASLRAALGDDVPIVAVAGNHEFWGRCLEDERVAGREAAAEHGVTFLDDAAAVVAGVRFVGATLWTDYRLAGDAWVTLSMAEARRSSRDYRAIRLDAEGTPFSPQAALALHLASRSFLARTLAEPFDGPTVVVTHHAPSVGSIAERYARNGYVASSWVASDLTDLMAAHAPALWVHGHCHASFDYGVGDTRVLCNPHGYGGENPDFDPLLTVAV